MKMTALEKLIFALVLAALTAMVLTEWHYVRSQVGEEQRLQTLHRMGQNDGGFTPVERAK